MITTNAAWNVRNGDLAKKPIYIFAIGGQDTVYSSHDLVREGITGALPAYEPWLCTPTGATQSIDVQGGTSSIGELECEVIDYGGAVRQLVGTNTLEGQSATLSVGYPGLAITDFITLHIYTLYKIIPSKAYTSFLFRSRDRQIDEKRTIWDHPLNGEALATSNPWILQGTPCEIIQALYLLGLKLDVAKVDRAWMLQLDSSAEGLYCASRPFYFTLDQPFQVKSFLENQLYKTAGLYPVVNNLGQLSVRSYRAPAAGPTTVLDLNADNITVLPEFDRMEILNDFLWKIDADSGSNSGYKTTLLFLDATSISTFGRSNEHEIDSDGLRSELGAQWFIQDISQRMFARFAGSTGLRGGAPVLQVEAFYATLPVWVGDYVTVTHPLMPDLFTGALGVSGRIFEVIDRSPDYANGKMQFKLLDTGLTGVSPAYQYAAASRGATIDSTLIY